MRRAQWFTDINGEKEIHCCYIEEKDLSKIVEEVALASILTFNLI
jgi:hypothetical protein